MAKSPRYKKSIVALAKKDVAVYASPKISVALNLINEMSLYEGVRMIQLVEAVYDQGKKDGARSVFEEIEGKVKEVQKAIPYKNPGKPKKKST